MIQLNGKNYIKHDIIIIPTTNVETQQMSNIYFSRKKNRFNFGFVKDVYNFNHQLFVTSNSTVNVSDKLLILNNDLSYGKKGDLCTFIGRTESNTGNEQANIYNVKDELFSIGYSIEKAIELGDVIKVIASASYGYNNLPYLSDATIIDIIENHKSNILIRYTDEKKLTSVGLNGEKNYDYTKPYQNENMIVSYIDDSYSFSVTELKELFKKFNKDTTSGFSIWTDEHDEWFDKNIK